MKFNSLTYNITPSLTVVGLVSCSSSIIMFTKLVNSGETLGGFSLQCRAASAKSLGSTS